MTTLFFLSQHTTEFVTLKINTFLAVAMASQCLSGFGKIHLALAFVLNSDALLCVTSSGGYIFVLMPASIQAAGLV